MVLPHPLGARENPPSDSGASRGSLKSRFQKFFPPTGRVAAGSCPGRRGSGRAAGAGRCSAGACGHSSLSSAAPMTQRLNLASDINTAAAAQTLPGRAALTHGPPAALLLAGWGPRALRGGGRGPPSPLGSGGTSGKT